MRFTSGRIAALGLAAALGANPALAVTTFSQSPASGISNPVTVTSDMASGGVALSGATTYASQGVAVSAGGGNVSIPGGVAFDITTEAATAAGETTGVLTLTLPAGVSFVPGTPPVATLVVQTTQGPVGSIQTTTPTFSSNNTVATYKFTTAAAAAVTTSTIQLSYFLLNGATALGTPGNSITIQAQVTGIVTNSSGLANGVTTSTQLNDPKPITGTIATSANGIISTSSGGPGDSIAIAAGTIGTNFNSYDVAAANGSGSATVIASVADLGKVSLTPNGAALRTDATAAQYTSTTSPGATVIITGTFSSYSLAYLAANATCTSPTVPAGAIAGTVTASNLTFPNVPLSGNLRAVCLISSGQSLLSPTGPVTASFTIGSQSSFIGALGTNGLPYAGTPFNLTYVFSQVGNYQGYLRLVNTTTQPADVFAIARTDNGTQVTGKITTLAANSSVLMTHDQAFALMGAASAFPTGTRGVMTILTPAPALGSAISGITAGNAAGVSVTSFVVNPGGSVTNLY